MCSKRENPKHLNTLYILYAIKHSCCNDTNAAHASNTTRKNLIKYKASRENISTQLLLKYILNLLTYRLTDTNKLEANEPLYELERKAKNSYDNLGIIQTSENENVYNEFLPETNTPDKSLTHYNEYKDKRYIPTNHTLIPINSFKALFEWIHARYKPVFIPFTFFKIIYESSYTSISKSLIPINSFETIFEWIYTRYEPVFIPFTFFKTIYESLYTYISKVLIPPLFFKIMQPESYMVPAFTDIAVISSTTERKLTVRRYQTMQI
jgi:hypothetical protein